MIFSNHFTVIFITRSRIRSAVFSDSGKIIQKETSQEWNENTLPGILNEIAGNGPDRARVVLGEEFCYVTTLKSSEKNREAVLKEVEEIVPEDIRESWDFRHEKNSDLPSQVAVIQPRFWDFFSRHLLEADFEVEAMEPESIALARLLAPSGFSLIMAYEEKALLVAVKNGVVAVAYLVKEEETLANFESFLAYVQKKCNARPEKLFVSQELKLEAIAAFNKIGLTLEVSDLNPLLGAAKKKDLRGEDSRVLNIKPENFSVSSAEKEKAGFSMTLREKILAVLFVIAFATAVAAIIFKR